MLLGQPMATEESFGRFDVTCRSLGVLQGNSHGGQLSNDSCCTDNKATLTSLPCSTQYDSSASVMPRCSRCAISVGHFPVNPHNWSGQTTVVAARSRQQRDWHRVRHYRFRVEELKNSVYDVLLL
jgi:hypothetical protein